MTELVAWQTKQQTPCHRCLANECKFFSAVWQPEYGCWGHEAFDTVKAV